MSVAFEVSSSGSGYKMAIKYRVTHLSNVNVTYISNLDSSLSNLDDNLHILNFIFKDFKISTVFLPKVSNICFSSFDYLED